jgi:hypothetical protein
MLAKPIAGRINDFYRVNSILDGNGLLVNKLADNRAVGHGCEISTLGTHMHIRAENQAYIKSDAQTDDADKP